LKVTVLRSLVVTAAGDEILGDVLSK